MVLLLGRTTALKHLWVRAATGCWLWYFGGDTEYRLPGTEMVFKVAPQTAEYLRETSRTTGALVTGRRTFDLTHGWGGGHPLGVPVFVLTHRFRKNGFTKVRLLRSLLTASKAL